MIQKKKFSDAIAANISVVGVLLPDATQFQRGLISTVMYKTSITYSPSTGKKTAILKKLSHTVTILELVGRTTANQFVHLIIKVTNKNVNIIKGAYNTAPNENIKYNFYQDDDFIYLIVPDDGAYHSSIRLIGTTDSNCVVYNVMTDVSIDGLTPIVIY